MTQAKARLTVEIERALLRRVKAKAALQDTTISDIVRTALRRYVTDEPHLSGSHPPARFEAAVSARSLSDESYDA